MAVLGRFVRESVCALSSAQRWMRVAGAASIPDPPNATVRTGLEAFFEAGRDPDLEKSPHYGRSWRASELRLKSWDDLHKLWYVLYKEKNMILSQALMLKSQKVKLPNPERLEKVKKSMCRIKQVLTERALLEKEPRKQNILKKVINTK